MRRGRKVNELACVIEREVFVGALAELLELCRISAADPARSDDIDRFEGAGDAVFVGEPEGDHVELQRPDGAEDQVIVPERAEELGRAFLAELVEALLQRLHAQRILEHGAAEQLRGEIGDSGEGELLALGERVADVDGAVVVQADDVACPGLVRMLAVCGHERQRIRDADFLSEPHVMKAHSATVGARADAQERDPVAVPGIHVGLDLEHEACQGSLVRFDHAGGRDSRPRRRRMIHERMQQFLDAEIRDRRAEVDRRLPSGEVGAGIECGHRAADELDLVADRRGIVAEERARFIAREPFDRAVRADAAAAVALVNEDLVPHQVIDAGKFPAHADRPGNGSTTYPQYALDLIEQLDRRASVAVELVDESHDRRIAEPADFHQLDRALLDALRAVDDHERRIDGGQRAVGVLGKVLVPGRVEQVDDAALVRELHDRGRDRDSALLLQPHPVGGRMARSLASLDGARHLDRAAEQQELFGQRRLAGVRVRDDRKTASAGDFVFRQGHVGFAQGARL